MARRWVNRLGDELGDEQGSVSLQLVIATPLLLLLILSVVQFALWEHATHVAEAAANQGLAAGRVQGGSEQAADSQARTLLVHLGSQVLTGAQVSASRTTTTTTVIVRGSAEGILPFLHLPVRSVAAGPTEQWTAGVAGRAGP